MGLSGIASFPMYAFPELAHAHDRLWQSIVAALGFGPTSLTHPDDLWCHWTSPDLLLSQTCGLPYRARLHTDVVLIGTPDYGLEGCPPGYYRSVFVARRDDPRASPAEFDLARLAFNDPLSQSGWAAPATFASETGIRFNPTLCSGSHHNSALAVADGRADLAALDAQTWRLLQRYQAFAQSLKEIGTTKATPGLPLITAPGHDPKHLFDAVSAGINGLSPEDRAALCLEGVVAIDKRAYLKLPLPPAPKAL